MIVSADKERVGGGRAVSYAPLDCVMNMQRARHLRLLTKESVARSCSSFLSRFRVSVLVSLVEDVEPLILEGKYLSMGANNIKSNSNSD